MKVSLEWKSSLTLFCHSIRWSLLIVWFLILLVPLSSKTRCHLVWHLEWIRFSSSIHFFSYSHLVFTWSNWTEGTSPKWKSRWPNLIHIDWIGTVIFFEFHLELSWLYHTSGLNIPPGKSGWISFVNSTWTIWTDIRTLILTAHLDYLEFFIDILTDRTSVIWPIWIIWTLHR